MVALEEQDAEGQALRHDQAGEEDQEQPRAQGARPGRKRLDAAIALRRGSRDFDRHGEDIAFAAHGLDVGRLARIVAQALAQAADQQVDRAVEQFGFAPLRQVEQLVAVEHALRMVEEDAQQPVFGAAQRDRGAVVVEQMARRRCRGASRRRPASWPASVTWRFGGSMRVRRSTALMRASSSRAAKGLTR